MYISCTIRLFPLFFFSLLTLITGGATTSFRALKHPVVVSPLLDTMITSRVFSSNVRTCEKKRVEGNIEGNIERGLRRELREVGADLRFEIERGVSENLRKGSRIKKYLKTLDLRTRPRTRMKTRN